MVQLKGKTSVLDTSYTFFVVLSLVMYLFGHSTEFGRLPFPDKLFYIPCGVCLVLAFMNRNYWSFTRSDWLFLTFYSIAFIYSSIFIGLELEDTITCILAFLVFRYLSHINLKKALVLLTYWAPIVIAIHYLFSSPLSLPPGYRYGGFQGDPNCFSFAMNLVIYACGVTLNYSKNTIARIIALVSIAGTIPLILAAASRGGVAIMLVLLFFMFRDTLRRHKVLSFLIAIVLLFSFGRIVSRFDSQLTTVSSRYNNTMEGEDYRMAEFSIVPAVLSAHPEYTLLGIGYSQSIHAHEHFPEYYHEGRAHNTYMSVLLEEGVIGFILFISFLISVGRTAFRNKGYADRNYRIILYFSILFFIFTIYSLPFLPFWFAISIVSNKYDILNEDEL